jgi:hypothetical protein
VYLFCASGFSPTPDQLLQDLDQVWNLDDFFLASHMIDPVLSKWRRISDPLWISGGMGLVKSG